MSFFKVGRMKNSIDWCIPGIRVRQGSPAPGGTATTSSCLSLPPTSLVMTGYLTFFIAGIRPHIKFIFWPGSHVAEWINLLLTECPKSYRKFLLHACLSILQIYTKQMQYRFAVTFGTLSKKKLQTPETIFNPSNIIFILNSGNVTYWHKITYGGFTQCFPLVVPSTVCPGRSEPFYILSIPKVTANLYCICLSIPHVYT